MAQRGRPKGIKLSEEHRDKIAKSNILSNLIQFSEGKREMSAAQVTASLGLLKKALPDLQSISHEGELDHSVNVNIKKWE